MPLRYYLFGLQWYDRDVRLDGGHICDHVLYGGARDVVQEVGIAGRSEEADGTSNSRDEHERSLAGTVHQKHAEQCPNQLGQSQQTSRVIFVDGRFQSVKDLIENVNIQGWWGVSVVREGNL